MNATLRDPSESGQRYSCTFLAVWYSVYRFGVLFQWTRRAPGASCPRTTTAACDRFRLANFDKQGATGCAYRKWETLIYIEALRSCFQKASQVIEFGAGML